MRPHQLSRRTMIHGLGACVGLPFLEAMLPRSAHAKEAAKQQESAPPARSIFIHVNSGVANEAWYPTETGRDFQWSRTLAPLASVREDVCVISGLGHNLQGHPSTLAYYTARDVRAPDVPIHGVSIDQVMAETTEEHTRHPSLNLGSRSLSYNRSGTNLPTLTLTDAFEKLFVQDDAKSRAQHRYIMSRKKSLLDSLRDQMKDLTKRLGQRSLRTGSPIPTSGPLPGSLPRLLEAVTPLHHLQVIECGRLPRIAAWIFYPYHLYLWMFSIQVQSGRTHFSMQSHQDIETLSRPIFKSVAITLPSLLGGLTWGWL